MAEVTKSEQPQTNGLENGLDEDERSKMRPADIDADVKEMERRKRVEMIMSSKLFREELERIIELQLKDGNGPAGLLQQISDMMGIQSGKLHTTHMFRGSNCVTPINDIRGVESMGYEKGEKNLRCKLASVFRLMDLYGWSQGINNQITARLNQDEEHFLVNPHGMLFNEITASSLVKVDMQGNIVEPGTTNFSVNTQGFLLHSAIHASRPDVNCVIHIKTPSVLAVSSLKCGLLPICQEALVIGEVSQHPFVSGIFEPEEREKIIRNLGPHNKVLLLHNHGAVCCGATVEEAFYNVYNTVLACETQMKLMPIGVENLLLVSDETRKQVYDAAHRAPDASASGGSDKKKFRVGEMEFEALIRMLDNAGFRTGYIYRHPLVKGELPKPKNDVEVPPAVSSLGYLIEQEELYKQGNWKKYIDGRNRLDRTKWLNSPNVYQKVEILETGTSDPKKITKWVDQNSEEWVAESSPTHSSTPVKIDSALQFVPKGTNPKEFKKLQQQIKENRRADKITSGPQSHILEGVSWEEAKKLQDANITQTGDQVILVGAASKGIIQRNYQHNALVYKTPYAKNPFDSMSDKEIEDYKQLVERKQRGDTDYEESQSESEAISSSRQDGLRHFKSPLLSPQSATSETEEESRDEPRVLRIETKTAPRPIQAEVVLSDGESDTTDARVERSHSARYPKAEKPESVTLMNSFRKSWSLKREKDKSKDVGNIYDSRNLQFLKECELDRKESLHCYVARVKQLTHKPIIVDLGTKSLRPLLKSASDPCNLSTLSNENESDNRQPGVSVDINTSLSCSSIANTSELQQRLNVRKKLLHSAKMKFLGYHNANRDNEVDDKNSKSPMRVLISEIRDTINEIMSPERSKVADNADYFDSMRWIDRSKLASRGNETTIKNNYDNLKNKNSMSKSLSSLNSFDTPSRTPSETFINFKNDFNVLKMDLENKERSDTSNCKCAIHGGNLQEKKDLNQPPTENFVSEVVTFVNASEDEATYTITEDSLLPTYSFTESTETEWYYNKTIMTLENSQTVLEIKDNENKEGGNLEIPVKYIDTGIDTDFTSDKEVEMKTKDPEEQKEPETTEDIDNDAPVCESSGLNKSSETDSSFLKSSSGRTSNDVDTSFAFKTETETASDKSPEKGSEEKKRFLEEMLRKTKEPIREESSDSEEIIPEKKDEQEASSSKPEKILESPEFTNIDTEDAPITSSSKDTSPEVVQSLEHFAKDEEKEEEEQQKQLPEVDSEEEEKENIKESKKKKNVKSATKITVKKELKEKNSKEPVVSEIRLTIKNLNKCQSEKYEVKIQDVTNTSEDLSRSVSTVDGYESFEIVDKSCDCDAQQNLEELQEEVSSTIEKLQTIENYFEDEIKKHSSPQKKRNGSDEFTIEYNYREFEEVLNESKSKMAVLGKDAFENVKDTTEFFVSSPSGDFCGEIELCDDGFGYAEGGPSVEEEMEDLAMSSAFVAAVLSETVLGVDEQVSETFIEEGTTPTELEVICNMEEIPDVANFEVVEDFGATSGEFFAEEYGLVNNQQFEEEKTHQDCQQPEETPPQQANLTEETQQATFPNFTVVEDQPEIQEPNFEQTEIEDFWNNHMTQNEEPEEETTYQSCQSGFDLEKYEPEYQLLEEGAEIQNEQLEDEKMYQDCQPSFITGLFDEIQDCFNKKPSESEEFCQHIVGEIIKDFGDVQNSQQPEVIVGISENEKPCQDSQPLILEEETKRIELDDQQNEFQYCQHIVEEIIEDFEEVQRCRKHQEEEIEEQQKLLEEEVQSELLEHEKTVNLEEETIGGVLFGEQEVKEPNEIQDLEYIVEESTEVHLDEEIQEEIKLQESEIVDSCERTEKTLQDCQPVNSEEKIIKEIEGFEEQVSETQECQQLEEEIKEQTESQMSEVVDSGEKTEKVLQDCQPLNLEEEIIELWDKTQGCQLLEEEAKLQQSEVVDSSEKILQDYQRMSLEKEISGEVEEERLNETQMVVEIQEETKLQQNEIADSCGKTENTPQDCQHMIVEEKISGEIEVYEVQLNETQVWQQFDEKVQGETKLQQSGIIDSGEITERSRQDCQHMKVVEEISGEIKECEEQLHETQGSQQLDIEVQEETKLQQDSWEKAGKPFQDCQNMNVEVERSGEIEAPEEQLNETQSCQQLNEENKEEEKLQESEDIDSWEKAEKTNQDCQNMNVEVERSGEIEAPEEQLNETQVCQQLNKEIQEETNLQETKVVDSSGKTEKTLQEYQPLNLEEEIIGEIEAYKEEVSETQGSQHLNKEIKEEAKLQKSEVVDSSEKTEKTLYDYQPVNLEVEKIGLIEMYEEHLNETQGSQQLNEEIKEEGKLPETEVIDSDEKIEKTPQDCQHTDVETEISGEIEIYEEQLNETQSCQQLNEENKEEEKLQESEVIDSDEKTEKTLQYYQPLNLEEETSRKIASEELQDYQPLNLEEEISGEIETSEEHLNETQVCQQLDEEIQEHTKLQQIEVVDTPEKTLQDCQPVNLEVETIGEIESVELNEVQYCQHIIKQIIEGLDELQYCQQLHETNSDLQNLTNELKFENNAEIQYCQPLNNITEPENNSQNEELTYNDVIKLFFNRTNLPALTFPPPLKAITFESQQTVKNIPPVDYILNCLLTAVVDSKKSSVNDVINFIVTNEESPTDSLTEFEDMENIISTSSSVVADIIDSIESQLEGEVESLPDEEEHLIVDEGSKKKLKKDAMFKVTISTPAKKEIFINYSLDHSCTFNTTSDLDQIEELCNSYIKTDDVNDDFENLSSDNPDYFSIDSSGKNSLSNSFCSVDEPNVKTRGQFCCVGCETNFNSPRSLAIIQEVDEGDSSASSEVAAT